MKRREIREKSPQIYVVKELVGKILKTKVLLPRWVAHTLHLQVSKGVRLNSREEWSS